MGDLIIDIKVFGRKISSEFHNGHIFPNRSDYFEASHTNSTANRELQFESRGWFRGSCYYWASNINY